MPLHSWTPLEYVDDDLLTLEAAALLSLAVKQRAEEVKAAVAIWRSLQSSLSTSLDPASDVASARTVLNELLQMTGLVLPSAVGTARLTSVDAAVRELSGIVARAQGAAHSVRAAVGLLNLALEKSTAIAPKVSDLFCNGLLDRAWQEVEQFAASPRSRAREIPPPQLRAPASGDWNAHDPALLGDYTAWAWGIGPMFQTLGGWDSTWLMSPGVFEDEHWDRIRYWAPLPHLVLGRLAWSDPALGVARWILMGKPDSTPELSLLDHVWGADSLMYFSHPQMDWAPHSQSELGFSLRNSGKRISRIYESTRTAQAFSGCGELHIQEHLDWQLVRSGQTTARPKVFSRPRGISEGFVLELPRMAGWYSQLQTKGDELSAGFPGTDLKLTVIAPPVGKLGTFQRSPISSLWYSGPHEVHLWGHGKLAKPLRRVQVNNRSTDLSDLHAGVSLARATAAAFWVASELARRHPDYFLQSDGPGGVDGLRLVGPALPAVSISRHGTLTVDGRVVLAGGTLVGAEDKRKLIMELEESIGLLVKDRAAPSTHRTITYRAMSHLLALGLVDKAIWNIAPAAGVTDGGEWAVTRDGQPVATLTDRGVVHCSNKEFQLLDRYCANARRLTPTISEVFGSILP